MYSFSLIMQISLRNMGHIELIFWYSMYMGMQTISANHLMNVWYTIQAPTQCHPHCSNIHYIIAPLEGT